MSEHTIKKGEMIRTIMGQEKLGWATVNIQRNNWNYTRKQPWKCRHTKTRRRQNKTGTRKNPSNT